MVVKSGSNVSLTCHATGFPVPSITWNKEELEVIPSSVVVTIDPLARVVVSDLPYQRIGVEQAGLHSCVAVNDVGQSKAYYVIEGNLWHTNEQKIQLHNMYCTECLMCPLCFSTSRSYNTVSVCLCNVEWQFVSDM